jgi:hypothetical protein
MSEIRSLDKRNSAKEDEIGFGKGMWGMETKNGGGTEEQMNSSARNADADLPLSEPGASWKALENSRE